jgi:nicotinamide riboside kinase
MTPQGVIPAQAGIQPGAVRIALLGAESTGKTRLAQELAAFLRERGLRAVAVPEALRAWCAAAGRAPRPEEQLAIAREQEAAVDAAAGEADFVVADTTALMVAIYAGMLFPDSELLRFALARQQAYAATLVTGLDLPWVADGLHRDAGQPREDVDALVRSLLQGTGVAFHVVYGQGRQRLDSALQALDATGVLPAGTVRRARASDSGQAWTWVCDKCSDPGCEHRLFTRLRESR